MSSPTPAHRRALCWPARRPFVTTSSWTRERLLDRYALRPDRVHVAEPGADPADLAPGTAGGGELLCVAAVTAHKGHDVLLDALAAIADLPWRCVCVGTLDRDPAFVAPAAPAGRRGRHRRPGLPGRPVPGRATRRRLRRRGRARARLARRDLRHGRHRGPGARAAGHRDGGGRAARGARPRIRRAPARPAGAARRRAGTGRGAARLAERRRPAATPQAGRAGAPADVARLARRRCSGSPSVARPHRRSRELPSRCG